MTFSVERWGLGMSHKLVVCLGQKYEPDWLMNQFYKNMDFADDFAVLDCRNRDELWIHEGEYRRILREMALSKGADYIMFASADERYEKNAGKIIRAVVDSGSSDLFDMRLCELFTPNQYRVDDIWGKKRRVRLWRWMPHYEFANDPIQCQSYPKNTGKPIIPLDVNIYHLKMIEPENRRMRAAVFKELDKENQYQNIGYDYLYDNYGMELEEIPEGREYLPEYRKYIFSPPKELIGEFRCQTCYRLLKEEK